MPLATTADLIAAATAAGRAVVAFNVITLEHAEGIAAGAAGAGRPAVLAISHNAIRYHGGLGPLVAASREVAATSPVPLGLHLDHLEDLAVLRAGAAAGVGSAMFDAGALSYDQNVTATVAAVEFAHAHGIWLEAELGFVGGKASQPMSAHTAGVRTDPDEAVAYVAATGVDALAVAVGSSHAMTSRTASIDVELIGALARAVPVPLVLHGSSGVPVSELQAGVAAGLRKINVGTALNVAFTPALQGALAGSDSVDPRGYLRAGRDAVATAVAELLTALAAPR